eukprot:Gb_16046 [translate_table: standard]
MTRKRNRAVFQVPINPINTPANTERKKKSLEGTKEPSLKRGRFAPPVHKTDEKPETTEKELNKDRHNSMVFVGDLNPETTVSELKSRFEGFGSISRVKIADESGYGFVTFRARESAESAIRAAVDPYGIEIRNKRVLVSWANDPLPQWKIGIGVSKLNQDVLSKELPSKVPHGREGRGGNRATVLAAAAAAAAGIRERNNKDAVYKGREVVAYDDLL